MNGEVRRLTASIIEQQEKIGQTIQELHEISGIDLCGVYTCNQVHIYTLESLRKLAEIYGKEVLFSPLANPDDRWTRQGYFYLENTLIFALG